MRGDGRCSLSVSCRWSAAGSRSCHTASPGTSPSLRPQFQPTHSPLRSMEAVLGISPARWRGERSDVGFARWSTLSSHSLRLERRDVHRANGQRTCRSAPRVCPRGLPPVAGLSPPPSGGRCDPEQLLVEQLPVRSDLLLGRAEVDRSGAHRLVRAVLQFVFHVVARRVPWKGRLLRVQVGDVVRAAELQRNNVVDLKRAPTARSPAAAATINNALIACLSPLPDCPLSTVRRRPGGFKPHPRGLVPRTSHTKGAKETRPSSQLDCPLPDARSRNSSERLRSGPPSPRRRNRTQRSIFYPPGCAWRRQDCGPAVSATYWNGLIVVDRRGDPLSSACRRATAA